ncbi:hypothetical protein, conserved [Leishmania tarentolae]|uniref:Uncharacterized protein n=1 Tax=Leishmania tarentolae TaxID=5689 RepID=A0A640KN29_LEITA|nr:hypothetical protein, conserved [Leishmania tarentolae]
MPAMLYSSRLAVLVLFLLSLNSAKGDTAFDFEAQIVLENATVNSDFAVTEKFTTLITTVLKDAASSPGDLRAVVHGVRPHLVIMLGMWETGALASVQTAISKINGTYTKWSSGDSVAVSGALSHACMTNIGQQPSVISYTDSCRSWNLTLPPSSNETCLRNLSLTFYTAITKQSDPRDRLKRALCSFLSVDCELITYGNLTEAKIPFNSSTLMASIMPFSIMSENREETLTMLVSYAQFASVLAEHRIIYLLANGVQVFFQGEQEQFSKEGTLEQCVEKMWYLIFLIILVPLILIISHYLFYRGQASGKKSIMNAEREIRAGVQLNAAPWTNFSNGYQYGPMQGHGGLYSGGVDGRQGGTLYAPPKYVPQQFSERGSHGGMPVWGR